MTTLSKDLTAHAVATQLDAMAATNYEVGIFDAEHDRMWIRRWSEDEIIRAVAFLKAQNALGKHIYVRPEGSHALSLVDDLNAETVARMKAEGFAPAVLVETSPANFQAWLAHGVTLEPGLSTEVSKVIAQQYGGDPGSADWRHFGRLAGFTNRKPQYQQANGHYPFVRLREATGELYEQAPPLITKVAAIVEARVEEELARRQAYRRNERATGLSKSVHDFRNAPLYTGDYHRADLAYAAYALSRGATPADVDAAIRTRDLSHKGKESRQRDYVERTIAKAQLAVDRDNGPSR